MRPLKTVRGNQGRQYHSNDELGHDMMAEYKKNKENPRLHHQTYDLKSEIFFIFQNAPSQMSWQLASNRFPITIIINAIISS